MPHSQSLHIPHARPNVQVVWQVYAAFQDRDLPRVLSLLSPEVELSMSEEIPWGGRFQGHDGTRKFLARLMESISSTVVLERLIDSGDTVVAVGRTQGTLNASAVPFDVPIAHVWALQDGMVVRGQLCIDHPKMLAALGGTDAAG